ncbi:MAG TPA: IS110 family transposase [Candidatus Angelobacter sp.]|jgi:transposase|nr:IS110 family transposase [Candidatus Angelobacter sp.]
MEIMHYIGLDIHKKTISFCIKLADGTLVREGELAASRATLDGWMAGLPRPWTAAMEATLFTSWVYEHLKPHAHEVKVAHPAMVKAIAASKRKNDRVDADKITDLLRANLLPECYMAPLPIRNLRRNLRYRNLLVGQMTQTKNKVSGMLMEAGIEYNKEKLHQKKYFRELLRTAEHMPESLPPLLELSRTTLDSFGKREKHLMKALAKDPVLAERVGRLMTIPGVGPVTAITWALETGEISRFRSLKQAVSYCGLCGAEISSAGKQMRTPISKQRNKHLQTVLIEAAKLAPRHNPELAQLHAKEINKGNRNRATLAVARKLVAWLLAVDRREEGFRRRIDAVIQAA